MSLRYSARRSARNKATPIVTRMNMKSSAIKPFNRQSSRLGGDDSIQRELVKSDHKIVNYTDLIQVYLDFLDGKTTQTPTYKGRLNPDTIAQLKPVRELNSNGLLTLDSQDGLVSTSTLPNGKPYRIVQRAYITGLMPTFLAQELYSRFVESSDVLCFRTPLHQAVMSPIMDPMIPVTREYVGHDQGRTFTSVSTVRTQEAFEQIKDELHLNPSVTKRLFNQLDDVAFIDIQWGRSQFLVQECLTHLKDIFKQSANLFEFQCTFDTSNDATQVQECDQLTATNIEDAENERRQRFINRYTNQEKGEQIYEYLKQFTKEPFPTLQGLEL